MIIKVISLWNPWAWAMWNRLKEWETRSERFVATSGLRTYSGLLGIHSSIKPMDEAVEEYLDIIRTTPRFAPPFLCPLLAKPMTRADWFREFHIHGGGNWTPSLDDYGVLGGICQIGNIYQTQQVKDISDRERFFGNYAPGRRAIHCHDMLTLPKPIPMRGRQGAWNWTVTPEVEELIKAATCGEVRA